MWDPNQRSRVVASIWSDECRQAGVPQGRRASLVSALRPGPTECRGPSYPQLPQLFPAARLGEEDCSGDIVHEVQVVERCRWRWIFPPVRHSVAEVREFSDGLRNIGSDEPRAHRKVSQARCAETFRHVALATRREKVA